MTSGERKKTPVNNGILKDFEAGLEFAHYSGWDFLSFLAEICLLWFLLALSIPYSAAVPLAFTLATTFFWFACHRFVFRLSGRSLGAEYILFIAIFLSGLTITTASVFCLVQFTGMPVIAARILSGVVTALWNYYLNVRLNFRQITA